MDANKEITIKAAAAELFEATEYFEALKLQNISFGDAEERKKQFIEYELARAKVFHARKVLDDWMRS